ncbi:MAG TPA: hypothetical protein VL361_01825 [Candidatus Limnocylindrales bacterium]|jgi:hypothetical protein|nr:hypothetical protein [Candidatus Limnocylindrales bacterium]
MKTQRLIFSVLAAFACSGTFLGAQETNYFIPATKLEAFETNIGAIVIKGTTEIGVVSTSSGEISVRCREVTDTATGQKEHGLVVEVTRQKSFNDTMLIDYDELPSLLTAIDYMSKLDVGVTPLNSFDAAYTTKGGFRIAALGTRRTGGVHFGIRDTRTAVSPLSLSRDEMTRLWTLIDRAKQQLDALRR